MKKVLYLMLVGACVGVVMAPEGGAKVAQQPKKAVQHGRKEDLSRSRKVKEFKGKLGVLRQQIADRRKKGHQDGREYFQEEISKIENFIQETQNKDPNLSKDFKKGLARYLRKWDLKAGR